MTPQESEYRRMLTMHERRFINSPPGCISMVIRIREEISKPQLEGAIAKASIMHPLLGVRIVWDANHNAWFTSENVPPPPIRVANRISPDQWQEELTRESRILMEMDRGPLVRFVLLSAFEGSEIIVYCQHSIADGMALAFLCRDILTFLGDPARVPKRLPEPPLSVPANFPTGTQESKLINWIIKLVNKKWEKVEVRFDREDFRCVHEAFWSYYSYRTLVQEFTANQTARLVQACRIRGVTLNSVLNVALIGARTEVLGPYKGKQRNVLIPVNARDRLRVPVGEQMGVYAAGFNLLFSYSPQQSFWENVEAFNRQVAKKLDINDIFKLLKSMASTSMTLTDSQPYGLLGSLVPPTASRYAKLSQYANDLKNISVQMVHKKAKGMGGMGLTNLGRLDFPTDYGAIHVERFIFAPSAVPSIEIVSGVVTVGGKLAVTLNYMEPAKPGDNALHAASPVDLQEIWSKAVGKLIEII